MAYKFLLKEVLEELELTRNAVAVEAKIRPATVLTIFDGSAKRIELDTFDKLLKTLNQIAKEKGLDKTYTIDNIIHYYE